MTPDQIKTLQRAMLTVPGVTLRSGADGKWGPESAAALALVVAKAGGQPIASAATEADPTPSDLPPGYLPMLARIESNNRPYVRAVTSSASGLYQFIKATWQGEGGQWGDRPALAFGGLQPPVSEQHARAASFTRKNTKALTAAGIPVTRATLYAAHFFGAGTAVKVLRAHRSERADHLAGVGPTQANPSILAGKTVGQFMEWLTRKTA